MNKPCPRCKGYLIMDYINASDSHIFTCNNCKYESIQWKTKEELEREQ